MNSLTFKNQYSKYIDNNVNKSLMMNTIKHLVTGDNARVGGCKGEKKAAKFLRKHFENLGLDTEIQEFNLNRPVSIGIGSLKINNQDLKIKSFNGGTPIPSNFHGELIDLGLGIKEDLESIGSLKNKIALIQRGTNSFSDKVSNAFSAGAKAIIIYNNEDTGISTGSLGKISPNIPVLGISKQHGNYLKELLVKENNFLLTSENFHIDIEYHDKANSINILGTLHSKNINTNIKTIILGAHFDSASSPGASDNASGVAVMLEVARLLSNESIKKYLNYNIQFVSFGSEELGLLGSTAFVEMLKKENKINTIHAMINLDMVGVGQCINVFNFCPKLSDELSNLAVNQIKLGQGVYGGLYNNMASSDHAPFESENIPSCLVQTGPDSHFHTENDTIDKIDHNNLFNVAKAIAGLLLELN